MNPVTSIQEAIGANQCCGEALVKQAESPSLLQTLQRRKIEHEARLADLNAAIRALEENPDVMKVLELVARAR